MCFPAAPFAIGSSPGIICLNLAYLLISPCKDSNEIILQQALAERKLGLNFTDVKIC
jgi:hypothetical protein